MVSEQAAAARRRKIKLTAYRLFREKGVESVTFGSIAAHSGISESSIYHYFPQKSILMMELHKYLWREIAAELNKRTVEIPAYQKACGYRQIEWLIDAFGQVHLEHPGRLKFSLGCKLYWIQKKHEICLEEYESVIAPVMQQFAAALHKGVEDASVILHTDFDTCCFLLWGVLRSYLEQMVVLDALHGAESYFSQYFTVFKASMLQALHAQAGSG